MTGESRRISGYWPRRALPAALFAYALTAAVSAGAQSTQPQAEAQSFTPPPRSISDITAILDQEKPHPEKVAEAKRIADAPVPAGVRDVDLIAFYWKRGDAALDLGRQNQAIDDYQKALVLAEKYKDTDALTYVNALNNLARAHRRAGNIKTALEYTAAYVPIVKANGKRMGTLFVAYEGMAADAARSGDFATADKTLADIDFLKGMSNSWRPAQQFHNYFAGATDRAHGEVAMFRGNMVEAEAFLRRAAAEFRQAESDTAGRDSPPAGSFATVSDYVLGQLANVVNRQGRPVEAEAIARQALLSELQLHGRYSDDTVAAIVVLGNVIAEQGRFKEAEKLARTALDTFSTLGIDQTSLFYNNARVTLAAALVAERRWAEALAQYDAIRKSLADHPVALRNAIGQTLDLPVAALRGGRVDEALKVSRASFENRSNLLGDKHYNTVEAEGLYAAALAKSKDLAGAREHFAHAVPILLGAERHADDEDDATPGLRDQRLQFIVESYLDLLATEKTAAGNAEAFRVADAVRGRAVQRALAAAAARANVRDADLAVIMRKEQDDQREVQALGVLLATELALPSDQRDDKALAGIREQIDKLREARKDIRDEIRKRFPEYIKLIDPKPATVEQVQAVMRPGEALFAVYAGEDHTYVWAVPQDGPVAFAVSPLTRADIESAVKELRKALDPDAATIADIPAFKVELAYKLYAGLLAPVKPGWQSAKSLMIVPHGALGQLPMALLVTADTHVAAAQPGQPPFAGYKSVPWLVRQVAVTQLPSVTSLTTLRAVPASAEARKPFIGFGDPWFNADEAAEAQHDGTVQLAQADTKSVATRGIKVKLRSAPKTETVNSADLAQLPRLPDTAEEVREVAEALKADPAHDVFLGAAANERTVRSTRLDDRRVVMFATHGLVPGDLDGLNEPALALTAPSVAHVDGNGLLTVSKILGLHLDADWVVLSACNTASGNGAGAEAVSGLGLAFFYAGSRALLVSNWPVETTAARVLTTDLFRRQAANPDLARAEALRQAELALIDGPGFVDPGTGKPAFSYAHPLFWAPFSLVGDGGGRKGT